MQPGHLCLHVFIPYVCLHIHSWFQSDVKPDELLLKGSKTKERGKEKKNSKDKRKGQAADGSERRPVKAKVDELVVNMPLTVIQKLASTR